MKKFFADNLKQLPFLENTENWKAGGRKTHLISEAEDCLLPFGLVQTTLKLLDDKKLLLNLKVN